MLHLYGPETSTDTGAPSTTFAVPLPRPTAACYLLYSDSPGFSGRLFGSYSPFNQSGRGWRQRADRYGGTKRNSRTAHALSLPPPSDGDKTCKRFRQEEGSRLEEETLPIPACPTMPPSYYIPSCYIHLTCHILVPLSCLSNLPLYATTIFSASSTTSCSACLPGTCSSSFHHHLYLVLCTLPACLCYTPSFF